MTKPPFAEQPKVIAETVTDSYVILNVNYLLTNLAGLQVARNERPEGEEWPPLVTEILEVPGIECVVLRPYCVGIHRAAAFDFDLIIPEVERLLYWFGNALCPYWPEPRISDGGKVSTSPASAELASVSVAAR